MGNGETRNLACPYSTYQGKGGRDGGKELCRKIHSEIVNIILISVLPHNNFISDALTIRSLLSTSNNFFPLGSGKCSFLQFVGPDALIVLRLALVADAAAHHGWAPQVKRKDATPQCIHTDHPDLPVSAFSPTGQKMHDVG
uniref:Uncharacterized protein n=1 Tax=Oryza brachyantha TaxID=4533 RepID=J3MX42_ORYBR